MATPTQGQIEAAAEALEREADNISPSANVHPAPYMREIAKRLRALTAAAEAGPITTEELDKAQFGKTLHKRPSLPHQPYLEEWDKRIVQLHEQLKQIESVTIERCAQVAEKWKQGASTESKGIAAAIRALKDA